MMVMILGGATMAITLSMLMTMMDDDDGNEGDCDDDVGVLLKTTETDTKLMWI
jgi:hypothetical protein